MDSKEEVKDSPLDEVFASKPHIGEEIVKNLPMKIRLDVLSAVSRGFYEAICIVDKLKYTMKICGDKLQGIIPEDIFNSIISSTREFDKMKLQTLPLNTQTLDQLTKIAEKHGNSIKKLRMDRCSMDFEQDCDLLAGFLKKLPNLERWTLDDCLCKNYADPNLPLQNVEPVLKNLKTLNFYGFGFSSANQICLQLIASDTLERFLVDEFANEIDFSNFLKRQSKLSSVHWCNNFSEEVDKAKYYKHLKLEEISGMSWYEEVFDEFMQQLVCDQPTLRKIAFPYCGWNETTILAICHHAHQLQSLTCEMTNDNCIALLEIINLKQLKELGFELSNNFTQFEIFMDFTRLNMPSVKKLKLQMALIKSDNFDVNQAVRNFGQHWENIEELHYNHRISFNYVSVNRIWQSFRKLTSFDAYYSLIRCSNDRQTYPEMKSLSIDRIDENSLLHALQALPNLKYLSKETTCINFELGDADLLTVIKRLTTHGKLKKLNIIFNRIVSNAELEAIKQLCGQISEFIIKLRVREADEAEIMKPYDDRFYSVKQGDIIILKNHKY